MKIRDSGSSAADITDVESFPSSNACDISPDADADICTMNKPVQPNNIVNRAMDLIALNMNVFKLFLV